jgi:hypothetical protein
MGGICNTDEDCSPKMRTQSPSDHSISSSVGLCQCYARSSIYPFDECERQDDADYTCAIASCLSGACAGLRAYCTLPSPTPSLPIYDNLTLTKFVTDTYEEKKAVKPLSQCEGGCCVDRECSDGLICALRNGSDPVIGCIGSDASDTSYCTRPPCALGHCIYKKQPVDATIEVILAYYFAQMKCCAAKWSGVPSELRGVIIKEEYCNQVGFDINNCPPEDPDDVGSICEAKSICWGGEDGCAQCGTIQCSVSHYSEVWCCNAKNSGPPSWWLSLRTNRNANQFCNEVGFDITRC